MDRITLLSDDVILKILSLLPSKVAVSTSLLSNRWGSLWKHVPKLENCDPSSYNEYWRASRFVDKFLLHNKAPVLKTLHLTLSRNCPPTDIATWIRIAVSRGVRDLKIFQHTLITFPMSLYACQTLVTLRLYQIIIRDVPRTICFRSLKVLYCAYVSLSRPIIAEFSNRGLDIWPTSSRRRCWACDQSSFSTVVSDLRSLIGF